MADVKISALPAASSANAADEYPANQAGTTRKVTGTQLAALINPWTRVTKASDETIANDATIGSDAALTVSLLANTKYLIRGMIFFTTGATGDFKFSFTGPASPTKVRIAHHGIGGGAAVLDGIGVDTAYGTESPIVGTSTDGWACFDALIENGANAGTFAFQWAQNTSNGTDTTVLRGSWLEWATF